MDVSPEKSLEWSRVAPYLDRALELEQPERETWLAELTTTQPEVASLVRAMLAERDLLDARGFLSRPPLAAAAAAATASRAGTRIGAYTVDRLIGRGGMGEVWLAVRSDGRFEGRCAIKFLEGSLASSRLADRFRREGQALARLTHPNIARLLDAGASEDAVPYLALEYVDGERIDRYCDSPALSVPDKVRLFVNVIDAVAHAHSKLVIHRDIKPSNVLVTKDGQVKLLDFGIAKLLSEDPSADGLTRVEEIALTPEYAAPEQMLGEAPSTATDVYQLALLLFVLLTGKHPLQQSGTRAEKIRAALDGVIPPASQLADKVVAKQVRGDLDAIVGKGLHRDPAQRYPTAAALAEDLQRFLAHEPIHARPDSLAYRAGRFVRRHRAAVATAGVAALALVAATIVTTLQMLEANHQRDEAIFQSKRAEYQAQYAYQILSEVGGDGQPVTIRELMAKGIDILERNYGDDPRFVIGLLINLSGRYMDLGDTKGEHAALVKAEGLARKVGDPELIARVQCNTVETEVALGQPERASERMRDGLANLAKVRDPSVMRRAECGLAQARLLWSQDKLDAAIDAAMKVGQLIEENKMTDRIVYQTITSMLDVMLGEAFREHEALEWNRRGIAALERTGKANTLSMAGALHSQASILYYCGERRAALNLQRQLVQKVVSAQGMDALAPQLMQALGTLEIAVDEAEAGLTWLDRAVEVAAKQGHQAAHIGALMARARGQLRLRHLDRVLPDLETGERLAQEDPDGNRSRLRRAQLIRSELLMARGQPAEALRTIDALLLEVGYPERMAQDLIDILTLRARALLEVSPERAMPAAREALGAAEKQALNPRASADIGTSLLLVGKSLQLSGQTDAAREQVPRAIDHLATALGPEHSLTREAKTFLVSLEAR